MNEEDKLIEEQFKKLPVELQTALTAVPWRSMVKEIATLNKLSPEQEETFERETMFILYGFESPDDYINNLIREVSIDEDMATSIAEQVGEKILKKISTKLKEKREEPIVITNQETKEEAMKRLSERMGTRDRGAGSREYEVSRENENKDSEIKSKIPEIMPKNLPMVEEGEVVHDVAPATSEVKSEEYEVRGENAEVRSMKYGVRKEEKPKPLASVPSYGYQPGQDPYREPIE